MYSYYSKAAQVGQPQPLFLSVMQSFLMCLVWWVTVLKNSFGRNCRSYHPPPRPHLLLPPPTSRGGHRHLQLGRKLDIDLISELPPAPFPICMYPKCGNLCGQRGRKRFIAIAGVSGCRIFVPAPHASPPQGIGQRSKVVILLTSANK